MASDSQVEASPVDKKAAALVRMLIGSMIVGLVLWAVIIALFV